MRSIKITCVVSMLVALMCAATASADIIPVAGYWGVNGTTITDVGGVWLRIMKSTSASSITYVMDLGEIVSLETIGVQNRTIATNYAPREAKVYVSADESASGFNAHSMSSFTQQINPNAPSSNELATWSNAANVKRYIDVTDVNRRYVMVEITRTGQGMVASEDQARYTDFGEMLATGVVPEPATVLLLSLGTLVFRRRKALK